MAASLAFELKEFDATTLDGTDQNFGTALTAAARGALFFNTSDVDVYVSVGGTHILRIPAGEPLEVKPYNRHNSLNEARFVFDSGVQLTVTQVTGAGTGGDIIGHIFT